MSNKIIDLNAPVVDPPMEFVTLNVNVPHGFGRPRAHCAVMMGQNGDLVCGLSNTPMIGHSILAEHLLKVVLNGLRQQIDGGDGEKKVDILIHNRNIHIVRA